MEHAGGGGGIMKIKICHYGLAPVAFHADERKSVDILFPNSGRLHRITIPSNLGINFCDVLVEVDRGDRIPMILISGANGLSFREDPFPRMQDGKVVCFQCSKLDCQDDEHEHTQNFNILRSAPSFVYERGYILRLTMTSIPASSLTVVVTGFEPSAMELN